MSTPLSDPICEGVGIIDSSRWALLFRRAWWGNRLLIYMLLVPAMTFAGVLLGYPFQIVPDRADMLLRPLSLYGLMALLVAGLAIRHIGRLDFHLAPAFAGLWLVLLIATAVGPLLGNECVRALMSAGCTPAIAGAAIENAILSLASIWFIAAWCLLSSAAALVPGSGKRVALVGTALESDGRGQMGQRLRPTLLTGLGMLPVLGLLALLHWKGYPEAQRFLFPATKIDDDIGLTPDPGLIQLLVLASYSNYGPAFFAAAAVPLAVNAAIVLIGYRVARRIALALSGRFWSADRLPGILLLRSFSDDGVSVRPTGVFKRLTMGGVRLEEALGRELFRRGTLIAIGQPGERLPKLGAYRFYADDETWQPAVLAHMDTSAFVVVIGGTTRWVRWELEQIAASPNRSKLIYVLPPGDETERRARLALLVETLAPAHSARAAINDNVDRILAIATLADGGLCLCTGRPRHESDFQMATYMAMIAKVLHRE